MIRYKILEIERKDHPNFKSAKIVLLVDNPSLPDMYGTKQEAVRYIIENKLKFVTIVEIYVAE